MGLRFSERFKTFMHYSWEKNVKRHFYDAVRDFTNELERELSDLPERRGFKYSSGGYENYGEGFRVFNSEYAAGFGARLEIRIENTADHAEFVAFGTEGSDKGVPIGLREWVAEKMGHDERTSYLIARSIFRKGMQESYRSRLRQLPPSGQKGYDPILDLEYEGTIDSLTDELAKNIRSNIQRDF